MLAENTGASHNRDFKNNFIKIYFFFFPKTITVIDTEQIVNCETYELTRGNFSLSGKSFKNYSFGDTFSSFSTHTKCDAHV